MKFSYTLLKKLVPKAPPIQKLADALNAYSFEVEEVAGDMLDINIPANRWSGTISHLGIAREISAIFNVPLKNPVKTLVNIPEGEGMIKVSVREPALASRYSARYFELPSTSSGQAHVGESSAEVKKILKTCGINSINAVVDLMNFVMLETGQPLHAFDYDRIADNRGSTMKSARISADKNPRKSATLIVRRAVKGERLETLDQKIVALDRDAIVIADENPPTGGALGLAGIKGGLNSGTTKATKRIIVEAACFDPVITYRASRTYKIVTDASVRFSHGLSPALVDMGLDRVTVLLKEMGAKLLDSTDYYPKPASDEVIEFDPAAYEKLIGAPIELAKAKKYFLALGFDFEKKTKKMLVRIPAWRTDIEEPEDLIEEAARLEGLNNLKSQPPAVSIRPAIEEDTVLVKDRARNFLTGLRLDEVYNSSFVGAAELKGSRATDGMFERSGEPVEIENPIAEDRKYLRPSLVPLLTKNVRDNVRFFDDVRIFEIGKVFSSVADGVEEHLALGVALARKKDAKIILELKGLASELMESFGLGGARFNPGSEGLRIELDHRVVGALRLVHLEKGWVAAVGEINLGKVMALMQDEREFKPLAKFPAVIRDISLLVKSGVRIGEILETMQQASPTIVEDVDLIDEYADEARTSGRQSLTFRIVFQSEERTLSDEEVNGEMVKIVEELKRRFEAEVR